jgi:hypothetical protein
MHGQQNIKFSKDTFVVMALDLLHVIPLQAILSVKVINMLPTQGGRA